MPGLGGVCLVRVGYVPSLKGVEVWSEGVWLDPPPQTRHLPPSPQDAPRYGQPAVGTHPTGMHSCFFVKKVPHNTKKHSC